MMDPSPTTPPLPTDNHLKRHHLPSPSSLPAAKLAKSDGAAPRPEDEGADMNFPNPNPRIQRYLIAIEYIGTRFSGSQKQLNCRTVVGVLEEAFEKFIGRPVSIFCSSRTDAGVHALSNVCHVDVERISKRKPDEVLPPHDAGVVRRAVNHFLQRHDGDIMVTDARSVGADFHARYKAQERTYFYRLLSGAEPLSTFEKDRAWHIPDDLNVPLMQEACRVLIGHHDFSSFRASGCQANSPVRTLDELHVAEVATSMYFPSVNERHHSSCIDELPLCSSSQKIDPTVTNTCTAEVTSDGSKNGGDLKFGQRRRHRCYVITARARSFLYHQVRLLVGVLKCVGAGELTVSDVERILEAKTITAAKPMAPACGLYLGHVKYDLP